METIIYSDDYFSIVRIEDLDENEDAAVILFELIELPNIKLGLFDTFSEAENAMKTKKSSMDQSQKL